MDKNLGRPTKDHWKAPRSEWGKRLQALIPACGARRAGVEYMGGTGAKSVRDYLERGRTPPPMVLAAVAVATGCDANWLLTGKGEPFPARRPELAEIAAGGAKGPTGTTPQALAAALNEYRESAGLSYAGLARLIGGLLTEGLRASGSPAARGRSTPPQVQTGTPLQVRKDLYVKLVPIVGSWSPDAGLLPSPDYHEGDEADYVEFGPVPTDSICMELDTAFRWFPAGTWLVFGRASASLPRGGFGFFVLRETHDDSPRERIESFESRGKNIVLLRSDRHTITVAKKDILEYRPFIAAV